MEKLVYGGDGLARREGQVVLVPFVLPGERVKARLTNMRAGVMRAELESVESAAEGRVAPECPYFARCGGCHYQHASPELQVLQKLAILRETLARGGVRGDFPLFHLAAEPWAYRNRAQLHAANGSIGYLQTRSHKLAPVERCPISSPRINQTLAALYEMIRDPRWPRFLRSFELFTNETEVQFNVLDSGSPVARRFFDWCAERIPGAAAASLDYPAAGFIYRVSRRSFFQVNRFLLDALVGEALGGVAGEYAVDLYAGVGLLTLPLARRFATVTAVESGPASARDLQFNAGRAGLAVRSMQTTAEAFLADHTGAAPDFVLADPPRAGLGKVVAARLAALHPARLTIVSCDPATLARDLAALQAAGYHIDRMTLVDLFPQTFHIETVVHLKRD
ncbi:MAG: class I SAM-dependent RNA methyltransferase [Acidobacteria bacterium]|nr:class I SAM-dependent RNA methyltransferase [Acidobacteriota bacterium]